ncbi:hypothetical protein FC16_GL002542 [Loigolactobacillus coryniformis subsp. torquens DSM 20004 = KCTC 3535]|nr:hypothetical protein FC16_GL002542 [Loigolactobacillus coryniformis subsp. torquens DSM 20004 = KCTC 3535]
MGFLGVTNMETQIKQRLSVVCDKAMLNKVALFCDYYGIKENDLGNDKIAFFKAHQAKLDSLAQGYAEMASLNTEICAEFCNCEEEAALRIH